MRREGRFVPSLDKDVTVRVRVTGDTVCVAGLRAGDLDDFRVGQEVAVTPLQGTTAMTGSKLITADAAEFYLFSAYRLRFLPRSLESVPDEVTVPSDPMRINSAGLETTPLPAQGGSVVYFAAGLLPGIPVGGKEASPVGAVRPGMRSRSGTLAPWAVGGCRPYRAAWARDGWEAPRPVELPDLAADTRARVTWINDDGPPPRGARWRTVRSSSRWLARWRQGAVGQAGKTRRRPQCRRRAAVRQATKALV
jgi:hypothetical protein